MQKEFTSLSLLPGFLWCRQRKMSENPFKRRRIIKKLDFENCVVTKVNTKAKRRRRLGAKLTREVEIIEETPQNEEQLSLTSSPVLSESESVTSPVLMKSSPEGTKSPILFSKRKIYFHEKDTKTTQNRNTEEATSGNSPVFKVKPSKLKSANAKRSQNKDETEKIDISVDNSQRSAITSTSQRISTSHTQDVDDISYQIDDDFTQESKPNVEISSIESEDVPSTSGLGNHSVNATREEIPEISLTHSCPSAFDPPEGITPECECSVRKRFKKNSLRGRLEKIIQKQASEKILWQHQRRQNNSTKLEKLSVITFWSEETNFILKCQSLSMDSKVIFLFINSQWVPSVKRIKEGSVIRLYPPWQKISVASLGVDVLLNIICMEVLGKQIKMAAAVNQIRFESLPVNEYESNKKHFVESLFPTQASSFFLY